MARFCISCGAALNDGARFCGSCGAPVAEPVTNGVVEPAEPVLPSSPPLSVSVPPPAPPPPAAPPFVAAAEQLPVEPLVATTSETYASREDIPQRAGPNWLLIGGGAAILTLLLAYYLIFIRDDVSSQPAPAASQKEIAKQVEGTKFFAVADANIRDKATTVGTSITGKLLRGSTASGTVITGDDGATSWLELDDGKGFIAMSNLSETEPPAISKTLGDRVWTADKAMDLYATADAGGTILDRVAVGTPLTLFGLTANGFIEIKLKKGGVAYIADGARIAELSNAKGKPIAISFTPSSCDFGGDLRVEFDKLGTKSKAAYDAVFKKDYASDEERDRAMGNVEGKSYYQKLERSFNGVTVTGIGLHYESTSVYFADPAEKVIAAFRAAGFKLGKDGQFPTSDVYAGIGTTSGEGRTYGKSDLSCGV
jgi:hypothetical protein